MAPYPANTTPRLWVDYTDGINAHSMLFRFAAIAGGTAAMGAANDFLFALSGVLYEITVTGARIAAEGSDVAITVAWGGASTFGTGAQLASNSPLELNFVGRTGLGTMAKWFVYGFKYAQPDSFRFFPGDYTQLDDAIGALRTAIFAGTLIAIDTQPPSVYPYVNIQFNSYWESQQRR